MLDFKALKKRAGDLEILKEQAAKLNSKQTYDPDPRFWYPDVDEHGNSVSVIRFLPAPAADGDDGVPFVKAFRHSFKDPVTGLWYIENCLTTIKKNDPVTDYNNKLYKSGSDADKKAASRQKRSAATICNVFIVKDSINPDNNGQVKLFRVGNQIWTKVEEAWTPKYEDQTPINPFDLWDTGANFRIRIKTIKTGDGAQRNYTDSSFDQPSALFDDDSKIEAVWNKTYSLQQFLDPDAKEHDGRPMYLPYDVLQKKFYRVIGIDSDGAASDEAITRRVGEEGNVSSAERSVKARVSAEALVSGSAAKKASAVVADDEPPFVPDEKASARKASNKKKPAKEEPLIDDSELDDDQASAVKLFQNLADED